MIRFDQCCERCDAVTAVCCEVTPEEWVAGGSLPFAHGSCDLVDGASCWRCAADLTHAIQSTLREDYPEAARLLPSSPS